MKDEDEGEVMMSKTGKVVQKDIERTGGGDREEKNRRQRSRPERYCPRVKNSCVEHLTSVGHCSQRSEVILLSEVSPAGAEKLSYYRFCYYRFHSRAIMSYLSI